MLAVSAGRRLALLNPQTLRSTSAPPSPSKQTALDVEFTAIAWANPRLCVATRGAIRQYDSTGHFQKALLSDPSISIDDPISAIIIKSPDDIFFSRRSRVCRLNCRTGVVEAVCDLADGTVSGISLSSDTTKLAILSSEQSIVIDTSAPSPTSAVLKGSSGCTAVSFHSHTSRLLLTSGHQLSVYEISTLAEPLEPSQSFAFSSSSLAKEAVGLACSPFSSSLVAIACKGGLVSLVDLNREKGPIKTVDAKASLTSVAFNADGTHLLLGTETGQLLVFDLRSLDKIPKKITITADGRRVVGIAVQKKLKADTTKTPTSPNISPASTKSTKQASPRPTKPLASHDLNVKKTSLPHRAPTSAMSNKPLASPHSTRTSKAATRNPSASGTPAKVRKTSTSATAAKSIPGRKVSSSSVTPVRSTGGSTRGRENANSALRKGLSAGTSREKMESLSALLSKRKADGAFANTTVGSAEASATNSATNRPKKSSLVGKGSTLNSRSSASVASRALRSTLTMNAHSRAGSSGSAASGASTISARKIFPRNEEYGESSASPVGARSRSPSPNFDNGLPSPTTALPAMPRQRAAMDDVLSGVALRDKGRSRQAQEDLDIDADHAETNAFRQTQDEYQFIDVDMSPNVDFDEEINTENSFHVDFASASADSSAVQLSPLRGAGLRQTPPRPDHFNFSMDSSNRVEDFLKNVFKDAIYDFQQETRSELLGLHLDVLKVGRGLKREMKDVFDEYLEDDESGGLAELKRLREENRRLREEVARLKACV